MCWVVCDVIVELMLFLCEVVVDYMMLLGLYYLMGIGYYYGLVFWVDDFEWLDWNFVYYYCVDCGGIGFDCLFMGSNVVV